MKGALHLNFFKNIGARLGSLTDSVSRYPITVAFLAATAIMNAFEIGNDGNFMKFILGSAVGAVACAVAQMAYERFYTRALHRIVLLIAGVLLSVIFYFSIRGIPDSGIEIVVRTAVTIFALFIAFIWIAVVRSRVSFNESFMASFKALFQSAFFSGIIFLGCIAIIAAVDRLIVRVDSDAYAQTANIVFLIFAPVFFLSLIPVYPGRLDKTKDANTAAKEEMIAKRTGCPKFLEVLLSYIIIPLTAVFTLILLIYIVMNIGGRFWTDNLLEPLLIAYSITVIVVTILVGRLENKFAVLFKSIFPKVLIPIALFQVAASILIMTDSGVTYGRYYVIMYGIFAVFSGAVLGLQPIRKSGIIAAALILLSAVSLIPPVDAFTVSRNSQIATLETVLMQNGMLQDGKIIPNDQLTEKDQTKIIDAVRYLDQMEALDSVRWLPEGFEAYSDTQFYNTFGFYQYGKPNPDYHIVNVNLDTALPVQITGYDVFAQMRIQLPYEAGQQSPVNFNHQGTSYVLLAAGNGGTADIVLKNSGGDLVRFDISELFGRYENYANDKNAITIDEATFTKEGQSASLTVVVQNATIDLSADAGYSNAHLFVFVKFAS